MNQNRASFYEEKGLWQTKNLYEHLKDWSSRFKDKTALVEEDSSLTYEVLLNKVDQFANGLLELKVKKGDNVLLQLPNNISFVITSFALFKIGAVPIMSLPAHRERELSGIIDVSKPVLYIFQDSYMGFDYLDMAENLCKENESIKNCIVHFEEDIREVDVKDNINFKIHSWENIFFEGFREIEKPSSRDTALLLLSGGTTNIPKLIPRTHADYHYNAVECSKRSGLNEESVFLAVLPIAHNFPLACPGVIGTLLSGGKTVISKSTSFDEAFELIEQEEVTITSLVPAMLQLWLEVLSWEDEADLSSLEVIQVGGAMLDEKLARRVKTEIDCKLQQVFGTAEGLICMTDHLDDGDVLYKTQGKPVSLFDELRIVDDFDEEVEEGEFGELIVRGPYTIENYYRGENTHERDFTKEGFYRTGDKARFVYDGNIQIGGRIKEQINRAGEKIMPSEIESYLNKHPNIKESALIGVPDEKLGQMSVSCLVLEDEEINLKEIHGYLGELKVARYKWPDELMIMDSFPLTNVGKVNKKRLKEIATKEFSRI